MAASAVVNRVDVPRALELRLKGLSLQEIGDTMGVSAEAVRKRIHGLLNLIGDPDVLQAGVSKYEQLVDGAKLKILQSLVDDDKIKKASFSQLAVGFGILDDKARLEKGQSTSNIGMLGKFVHEAHQRLEQSPDCPQLGITTRPSTRSQYSPQGIEKVEEEPVDTHPQS